MEIFFIGVLIGVLIGGILGFWINTLISRWIVKKLLHDIDLLDQSHATTHTVRCAIEQHNGQFFLYRLPDWFFLAQSNSLEDCRKIAQQKLGKNFQMLFNDVDK